MKRRTLLTASAALSVAGTAAACSRPGGGDSDALTFQSLSDQPGAIAITKEIVEAWNSENPDTPVEIIQAGWDGVYDKLITQFSGMTAPDIIHYEAASVIPFALDGYLADLSASIDDEIHQDITDEVWDSVTVDGKIIAFPSEMQTYVVFANKTLLEDAGVEIPTGDTLPWEIFREIAAACTDGSVYGVGWGLKSPTATFMAMGPTFGGMFFEGEGADVTITVGDGEMAIPEAIAEMAFEGKTLDPASLSQSGGDVLASFYGGKIAMTVQGSYQAANMVSDAPEDFEWIELPPLEGDQGAGQAANPQTLSVNIDSKDVEGATAFLNFFCSSENMAKLNEADGLIPAAASAREAILESTGGANGWDMTLKSGEHLMSAPYLKVTAYPQWKDTIATPAYQQYLAQEIDEAGLSESLVSGWDEVSA